MYFIRVLDFKCNTPGTSTINEDGTYTIFINGRMSIEKQKETFIHELNHIMNNDFKLDSACAAELNNKRWFI